MEGSFIIYIIVGIAVGFVDSSLGMGYGTTLTPLLLLMGYEPVEIVPAVLLSECITGVLAGACHHEAAAGAIILPHVAGFFQHLGDETVPVSGHRLHLVVG